MHTRNNTSKWMFWVCLLGAPVAVSADGVTRPMVYDRARGELSPGTEAPTPAGMVKAIRGGSTGALTAMLEYGERVECLDCIPLLEGKLLKSDDPKVREMAAWWLRRRVFGYGRAAVAMRSTLMSDTDPVRRARAAEALGEFLDVRGLPALQSAVTGDDSVDVRLAAVRALGRLNAQSGDTALAAAFEDDAASVRRAALDQVPRMNFFKQQAAVRGLLQDDDAAVRLRAAQVVGELRIADADDALIDLLQDDPKPVVRQASAWALGRSGSSAAQAAIRDALEQEKDPSVLDGLEIALRMKR